MVAIKNIFKEKDDKEKLNIDDPEKADLEAFEVYITPTVLDTAHTLPRTRFCIRILFLLTCLLFGLFLIIGGVMLYRYFTTQRTWYDETCLVRYKAPEKGYLIDNGGLHADELIDQPIFKPKEISDDDSDDNNDESIESGELKQKIKLNLTSELEEIDVPFTSSYKQATFLHDFSRNWSAIYDYDTKRCFIFALDRSKISPPKNMLDMLFKIMSRYYLPDNILLHEKMVVDKQLEDLTDYGEAISGKCNGVDSYLLKKQHLIGQNHNIDKRNTIEKRCEFASNFIEATGKFTLAYDIGC